MHHIWDIVHEFLNRIHPHVTFLSKLTNSVCNRLSPSTLGENERYRKWSNLQWSKQHNPDKQTWSISKKMITTIYCRANNSIFLRPNMQLGQWKCNHFYHTQIHPCLYSPSTMEISTNTTKDNAMLCDNKKSRGNTYHTIFSNNMLHHSKWQLPHWKENQNKLPPFSFTYI